MDFNLTDEQQMLRDGVRRFAVERYSFEARKRLLATVERFSLENWSTYAELGWLALALPEEVGGLGCSFVETAIVMQELGRVLALEPYVTSAVLGAHIISASKRNERRQELLSQLGSGQLRIALAHSEPDARYELGAVQATVARAADGGYVLNGVKTLVFDAPAANQLIVSAALAEGSFGLFIMSAEASGVSMSAY